MKDLLKKKWFKTTLIVAGCIALVYALIYVDVILRARHAYLQGEKYWSWYETPSLKEKSLSQDFEKDKTELEKKLSRGKISQDEYQRLIDIEKFNHQRRLEESSIKYAYIWYQTVVELFSPPESKWVKLSRKKMPEAKDLWRKELKSKNIPFEEYMLE